jgi:hypothetical protein
MLDEVLGFYQETLGFTATPEEPTLFIRWGHDLQVFLQRAHAPGEVSVLVLEQRAVGLPGCPGSPLSHELGFQVSPEHSS